MTAYVMKSNKAVKVDALWFTGDNREDTKKFVQRPIIIRSGKFFIGDRYVTANHWVVRHKDGTLGAYTNEEFERCYTAA